VAKSAAEYGALVAGAWSSWRTIRLLYASLEEQPLFAAPAEPQRLGGGAGGGRPKPSTTMRGTPTPPPVVSELPPKAAIEEAVLIDFREEEERIDISTYLLLLVPHHVDAPLWLKAVRQGTKYLFSTVECGEDADAVTLRYLLVM